VLLLASVFVIAACGLVYELSAGALASYLLGDSVLQFSTIIGAYLAAMGVGSWLSRFIDRQLVAQFLRIELLVGVVGGTLPAALFTAHSSLPVAAQAPFLVLLYALVVLVGVLVGLEIPLVMRILKRHFQARYGLKDLVSQVLTFDYLGALVVALAFPLLLVPHLGLIRTGFFFGLLNAGVAVWALWLFRRSCATGGPMRWPAPRWWRPAGRPGRRRAPDHLGRGPLLRRDHPAARDQRLPARGRHPQPGGHPPVPQRQPAVPLARRVPLPRGPGAPGHGGPGRAQACWCWAGATAWPRARSSSTPRCSRSPWWSWTRR
jgi:hypothetical protein